MGLSLAHKSHLQARREHVLKSGLTRGTREEPDLARVLLLCSDATIEVR